MKKLSNSKRAIKLRMGNLTTIEINKGTRKRLKLFTAGHDLKSMDSSINYLLDEHERIGG